MSITPVAELQKFLNVVFSVTYPVLNAVQATKQGRTLFGAAFEAKMVGNSRYCYSFNIVANIF